MATQIAWPFYLLLRLRNHQTLRSLDPAKSLDDFCFASLSCSNRFVDREFREREKVPHEFESKRY
jgi:hypothetical protein